MPSTNLPLSTALKGTAGFRYFPEGSTDRPEAVHALSWPPELVPQGGLRVDKSKTRSVVTSLDQKQTEHWSVGGSSGVESINLRIRFDGWPDSLLNMLDDAADGAELRYYPRLESTNLKFPSKLLGIDNVGVNEDEDRFGHAEWQADLQLLDASTDFSGYSWLRTPNKLDNPRLARGTTGGVAEGWTNTANGSHTVAFTVNQNTPRGQRIDVTDSSSTSLQASLIQQIVQGIVPGDQVRIRGDANHFNKSSTSSRGRVRVRWTGSTGDLVGAETAQITGGGLGGGSTVIIETSTAPSGTVEARVQLQAVTESTGATVTTEWRDMELEIF